MTASVILYDFVIFSYIAPESLVGSDKTEAQGLSSLHLYAVVENGTKRNTRASAVMINSRFKW